MNFTVTNQSSDLNLCEVLAVMTYVARHLSLGDGSCNQFGAQGDQLLISIICSSGIQYSWIILLLIF